jgi:hypothetical protein
MGSFPNPMQSFNPGYNPVQGMQPPMGAPQQPGGQPFPTGNPLGGAPGLPGNMQNPYGQGTRGGGNQTFNLAQTNLMTGLLKNALAGPMAGMLFGAGGQAGNIFGNLANLGSPYYQQQQRATFEQGNLQNQNAAALARQQLTAQGLGYTPSGATAATIGGMAQGGAQSLSEQFLQNLFQNEQMQLAGAQGLGQVASMFNPASVLTGINPSIQQPTNTGAEWLNAVSGLLPKGSYNI